MHPASTWRGRYGRAHAQVGVGRAATMALAHYVINEGRAPAEAADAIKAKRPVIDLHVATYPSIAALAAEFATPARRAKSPARGPSPRRARSPRDSRLVRARRSPNRA